MCPLGDIIIEDDRPANVDVACWSVRRDLRSWKEQSLNNEKQLKQWEVSPKLFKSSPLTKSGLIGT